MGRKLRWRTAVVVAAALALAGGGAGIAYGVTAQAAPSSDVITACVNNGNGMVRIVSDASQCRATEHPVELAASQAPRTVPVDCAAGGSISQVLADEPVIPPLTIDVTGTCTESVQVNRDNVTLLAAAPGAGIAAPTSGDTALLVNGTHVSLQGLTLTGGSFGLEAPGGGSITADHLHVTGAATGISLKNSTSANLTNVTIDNFSDSGVQIENGASAGIADSEIAGTGAGSGHSAGIGLFAGGHVDLEHVHVTDCGENGVQATASIALVHNSVIEHNNTGINTHAGGIIYVLDSVIQDNQGPGAIANPGTMFLQGTQVVGNGADGIDVIASNLDIGQGNAIKDNRDNGVNVTDNGVAQIYGTTIEGNGSNGVTIGDTSMADFREGTNTITGNGGWGVLCEGSPAVAMIRNNPGTVADNHDGQIDCPIV